MARGFTNDNNGAGLRSTRPESSERKCSHHGKTTFHLYGGKWQCLLCKQDRAKARRLKIKTELIASRGGQCFECGYKENSSSLHFHHVDPKSKIDNINNMITSNAGLVSIREEAKKCILLCANCHAEEHKSKYITDLTILNPVKDTNKEEKYCKYHGYTDFFTDKKGSASCKKCRSFYVADYRRKIKRKIVLYLGGECRLCHYDKCDGALHVHHTKNKNFNISGKGRALSWSKIKDEIDKGECVLLCGNCHAEWHNEDNINQEINFKVRAKITLPSKGAKLVEQEKIIQKCSICEKEISYRATLCFSCQNPSKIPPKEKLLEIIKESDGNFTKVGKEFEVSSNTIKKWLAKYNLPSSSFDYRNN